MKLSHIAAIATIIAAVVAVLQFINKPVQPSFKRDAPSVEKLIEREKADITLSLELDVYREKGERNWLFAMYEAALSMPYATSKSDALKKVVNVALESKDYNMAIIAAKHSPYATSKADMLKDIVSQAIKKKESVGYAVVAADLMPYSTSKSDAIKSILIAYEGFAKESQKSESNQPEKPANKANSADTKKRAAD